jgi:hypothetical protein
MPTELPELRAPNAKVFELDNVDKAELVVAKADSVAITLTKAEIAAVVAGVEFKELSVVAETKALIENALEEPMEITDFDFKVSDHRIVAGEHFHHPDPVTGELVDTIIDWSEDDDKFFSTQYPTQVEVYKKTGVIVIMFQDSQVLTLVPKNSQIGSVSFSNALRPHGLIADELWPGVTFEVGLWTNGIHFRYTKNTDPCTDPSWWFGGPIDRMGKSTYFVPDQFNRYGTLWEPTHDQEVWQTVDQDVFTLELALVPTGVTVE